jgi:hypothetical protein
MPHFQRKKTKKRVHNPTSKVYLVRTINFWHTNRNINCKTSPSLHKQQLPINATIYQVHLDKPIKYLIDLRLLISLVLLYCVKRQLQAKCRLGE